MDQQLVIGLGTGCCGLPALVEILNGQASVQMSYQCGPSLPWKGWQSCSYLRARLAAYLKKDSRIVGDAASYYLPYAEEIVSLFPETRLICLERDREEVIRTFDAWVERSAKIPTNHWGKQPSGAWYHHPVFTATFPQYDDVKDRLDGLGRYWDEYCERARRLARQYPDNFRVFDSHRVLTSSDGLRELLDFLGIARNFQVMKTALPEQVPEPASNSQHGGQLAPSAPGRCVVLVPYNTQIVPDCELALKQLEDRGYPVWRVRGYAAVDQARSQMATDALLHGFTETLWVDADVSFHPDAVERLRSHNLPVTSAIYPQKGKRLLASHLIPGTPNLTFGEKGGLREIMYAGAGFLHVRREVYETIQQSQALPLCNEKFARVVVPFFQPYLREDHTGTWYLAEDYAFCHRVREAGFKIYADTTIRLWHHGMYGYTWEDAGQDPPRFSTFQYHLQSDRDES